MTPQEKALNLCQQFGSLGMKWEQTNHYSLYLDNAKQCAKIAVQNEYHSLREQLFNLRACCVIENEKVYLTRLDELNKQEQELLTEIDKL